MTIMERAAYVKGLAEGLGFDPNTKEGKIINALICALEDMALAVSDLEHELETLSDKVEEIDEDLGDVEELLYLDEDEYDLCGCGEDKDDECGCGCKDNVYEVCCPTCGDTVCLDGAMLEKGSIDCPNCGELLEFDFEEVKKDDEEAKDPREE